MRAKTWFAVFALLILALAGSAIAQMSTETMAMTEMEMFPITFTATLTGDQLVPPIETAASGKATATLVGDLLVVTGEYEELSGELYSKGSLMIPAVAIHHSAPGECGGIVRVVAEEVLPGMHDFALMSEGGRTGSFTGVFKLTEEQIRELEEGHFYLQLYTETQPRGELRGQLTPTLKLELTAQDLLGVWENQSYNFPSHYLFKEDGTFFVGEFVEMMERLPTEHGEYHIEGNHLTFITDEHNVFCPGATGTYTVMLTVNDQLRLFPLQDECSYRMTDLRGRLLLPIEH
jgi:hypothetical protein